MLDFSDEALLQLKAELADCGFVCYETAVGGSGYGVLLPATRNDADKEEAAEGGAERNLVPDRQRFLAASGSDLEAFVESAGSWLYV